MRERMNGRPGTTLREENPNEPSGEILHYFDMNGEEILEGDIVRMNADHPLHSREIEVMATVEGYLGMDATNPAWIQDDKAYPGEYGVYPFNYDDLSHMVIVKKGS